MRRTPLTLLTSALAVAVLGAGALSADPAMGSPAPAVVASAPTPGFVVQPIHWKRCKDSSLREAHAKCGLLTVPLDYADPTGRTIKVGVSRVLHDRGAGNGAIFTNPGGPGGAGLGLATLGKYVPDHVGLTYDWYGFDPRGVGTSRPVVSCDKHFFDQGDRPSYQPTSKAILRYWKHKTKKYAADCATSKTASLMQHDSTLDTVADYETLREAIGASQITWYGFSYGTYVGEVYATLHPDRVRAMVLDGVIGPEGAWYQANLDQNVAFQKPFEKFLAWMGKYPGIYHVGSSRRQVEATYSRLRAKLAEHPAANGSLGPDELDDALLSAAYYNVTWLDEAKAFSDMVNHGDPAGLVAEWRGGSPVGDDSSYAAYTATECDDAPWPADFSTWGHDARKTNRKGPFLSWANTWFNLPCRTWGLGSMAQIKVDGSAYTGPVLMTEQSLDPATPYAGALQARALFPSSRIVVGEGGTSHAVSLYGVSCTDDRIADLLRDGSLPARKAGNRADVRCPPLLPPDPTPAPAASGASARAAAHPARAAWRLPVALRAPRLG